MKTEHCSGISSRGLEFERRCTLSTSQARRDAVLAMVPGVLKQAESAIPSAMSNDFVERALAQLAADPIVANAIDYAALFGTARQADEATAAHLWQLLMVEQVPVVAFFAIKWLPGASRQALLVFGLQVGAALAAMFTVCWFQW